MLQKPRIVTGHHAITELIEVRPKSVVEILFKKGFESSEQLREIQKIAKTTKAKIEIKPDPVLDKISSSHQGVIAFSNELPVFDIDEICARESANVVVVDGVEDPHNLGAIIRTSWLMGVCGIIIPQDRAVGLTASVHKVATGGVEHVPVLETSHFGNPLQKLKDHGFWVYGLSHKAKSNIYQLDIPAKCVWVVGAEDRGIRTATEKLCDELIKIPQASAKASYNASVAAAITLAEASRQQTQKNFN